MSLRPMLIGTNVHMAVSSGASRIIQDLTKNT
jgi:hypothetical protein